MLSHPKGFWDERGINMKNQRGQDLVEFALLIPFFFIIFFGIMYCGFAFGDYITLNNEARSAAREAVIGIDSIKFDKGETQEKQDKAVKDYYQTLVNDYKDAIKDNGMMTNLYIFDGMLISEDKKVERTYTSKDELLQSLQKVNLPKNPNGNSDKGSVIVIIKTKMNPAYAFTYVLSGYGVSLLDGYEITYIMYNENKAGNNS